MAVCEGMGEVAKTAVLGVGVREWVGVGVSRRKPSRLGWFGGWRGVSVSNAGWFSFINK